MNVLIRHFEAAIEFHTILTAPDVSTAALIGTCLTALVQDLREHGSVIFPDLLALVAIALRELQSALSAKVIVYRLDLERDACATVFLSSQAPFAIRRRGVKTRIATGDLAPTPDPVLFRMLARAQVWAEQLKTGTPLADVARTAGHSDAYIRTRAPLEFLSPMI